MTLKKTQWFSPNEWMRVECLTSSERLRRYHVLTIWGASESIEASYQRKVADIRKAECLTLIAWFLLAVSFFDVAWRHPTF
jgi:hypothetical protein